MQFSPLTRCSLPAKEGRKKEGFWSLSLSSFFLSFSRRFEPQTLLGLCCCVSLSSSLSQPTDAKEEKEEKGWCCRHGRRGKPTLLTLILVCIRDYFDIVFYIRMPLKTVLGVCEFLLLLYFSLGVILKKSPRPWDRTLARKK